MDKDYYLSGLSTEEQKLYLTVSSCARRGYASGGDEGAKRSVEEFSHRMTDFEDSVVQAAMRDAARQTDPIYLLFKRSEKVRP